MNDLFRFHVLRDPFPAVDLSVDLGAGTSDSRLLEQLAEAQSSAEPRQALLDAAEAFANSEPFLREPESLDLADELAAFADALDREPEADLDRLAEIVESSFGFDSSSLVDSNSFQNGWRQLRDTLVAVKIVPESAPPRLDDLVDSARLMSLVMRVAAREPALDTLDAIAIARAAPLQLPQIAVLPPRTPPVESPPPVESGPTESERQALIDRVTELLDAIESIRSIRSETPAPVVELEESEQFTTSTMTRAQPEEPLVADRQGDRTAWRISAPEQASETPVLAANIVARLPAIAREVLGLEEGQASPMTLFDAESTLTVAFRSSLSDAAEAIEIDGGSIFRNLHRHPLTEPGEHDDALDPSPATLTDVPKSHGTIKPAGIGDLLVTRQHTVRYEMGEIAHIENIAANEQLTRETRRLDTTETTLVQETETIQSDERDLQSTGRFGLNQETDRLLKQDVSRIPGQPSSDSYGSLVESAGTKQSSQKVAETYSRDITNRANSRITQRTRSQLTTRVLRELEEKAIHAFAAGADADVVVYQWVDRILQAQVFTYGKRLFYDIVIPEPAAFLSRALESNARAIPLPPRPAPFTLEPMKLNEWNWDYYVAGYGASGVTPPPPATVTIARTFPRIAQNPFSGNAETDMALMATGTEVTIPDGYAAAKATVRTQAGVWSGYLADFRLIIGQRLVALNETNKWDTVDLDHETGTIPITVWVNEGLWQFTIAIEVTCELTDERLERWQVATHAAILAASRERIADHDQRLANLRAALRLLTVGQPVERKAQLIRNELEKASLAIITNQQFDGLSAVAHSPEGYPQPYLPNIELYSRYLRFLEYAFEWEQMTWRYAPYFWGRKPYWIRTLLRDDPDPALADFLQAGAARVLVPVRPGFEASVLAFMTDGTVPTSDALSSITSPLYLPLLQELGQPDTALDDGRPYGDPWEIRLPTTLVALRRDGTLPRWEQQAAADGTVNWVATPGDAIP